MQESPWGSFGLGLLLVVVTIIGADGCGTAHRTAAGAAKVEAPRVSEGSQPATEMAHLATARLLNDGEKDAIGDADSDNAHDNDNDPSLDYQRDDNRDYHDKDDGRAGLPYGEMASASEARAISGIVKRYYTTLARGDSSSACMQVVPILAKATALDDGKLGPPYLRGSKSCAQVMRRLSEHYRSQLAVPVVVTGVRVKGDEAFAELGSERLLAGWTTLRREDGIWRMAQLFMGKLL